MTQTLKDRAPEIAAAMDNYERLCRAQFDFASCQAREYLEALILAALPSLLPRISSRKGGHNPEPSQLADRPAPPAAMHRHPSPLPPIGEAAQEVAWIEEASRHDPHAGNCINCHQEMIDALPIGTNLYTHPAPSPLPPGGEQAGGWIVGNGNADKWRSWDNSGSIWVDTQEKATRYHRRQDAELVHREDEDAWTVVPYVGLRPQEPSSTPDALASAVEAEREVPTHEQIIAGLQAYENAIEKAHYADNGAPYYGIKAAIIASRARQSKEEAK